MKPSRRDLMKAAAVATAAVALPGAGPAAAQAPTVVVPKSVKPLVIGSANGHEFRNGGRRTCVQEAFARIVHGEDPLDALIAGVNIVELDPAEDGVGYGGLPNADGVVQLDSCCMHGPRRRAGGVAALEGVRTPSKVARLIMEQTDHHLLVGPGAQHFARMMGFAIEDDLNTDNSRRKWLDWKRRTDPSHYLDPAKRAEAGERARRQMVAEGLLRPHHAFGTINCNGLSPRGELCGVTTTSGLPWKIAGRIGDSPILGAGLYVDGEIGAVGSTGRGEANLYNLTSFLIVELMRGGMHPKDAGLAALRRVKANTVERRLLDGRGNPDFFLAFYIVNRKGEHAGVSMFSRYDGRPVEYAVCGENGARIATCEGLLEEGGA